MRALVYDGRLRLVEDYPRPVPPPGEALVRVQLAGICNTDLEIVRGYMGFQGVLGHEFVGVVEEGADESLIGQRVVGEINCYCGECPTCRAGAPTHCPHRTTLGIGGRDGAFADYLSLPVANLHPVPEAISDEAAVFVEPLAAALEILEQVQIKPTDRVVVLGDGKLGLLVAQVLGLTGCDLAVGGRHEEKLAILQRRGIDARLADELPPDKADVVVECTGHPSGFAAARGLVRPRGTLVLKSTFHGNIEVNLSMLVVDEITLIGSRCGPFAPALRLLERGLVDVESLISATYPLDEGLAAFEQVQKRRMLKVLLTPQ
jgi:threonine dehydrogenase-like Zn-dependent dehydrogenase